MVRRVMDRWREEAWYRDTVLLMPSVSAPADIPAEGEHLVIIANVGGSLHFRVFGGPGEPVFKGEQTITAPDSGIESLRKKLENMWPPHEPSQDEKNWVIAKVRSIFGHPEERRFASITATYGYYTLLPFLFPWQRREKVRWLINQYTEALATYPMPTSRTSAKQRDVRPGPSAAGSVVPLQACPSSPGASCHRTTIGAESRSRRHRCQVRAASAGGGGIVNYVATHDSVVPSSRRG